MKLVNVANVFRKPSLITRWKVSRLYLDSVNNQSQQKGLEGLMALSLGSLYPLILQRTKESLPLLKGKLQSCCDEWKHGGKEWGLMYGLHSHFKHLMLVKQCFHGATQWSLDQRHTSPKVTPWHEDGKELNVPALVEEKCYFNYLYTELTLAVI